ncbi:MAG: NnrS family protein, partial [Myxococcales bacterium]|nr:NnrS family protein [Myxococcales bacterium]
VLNLGYATITLAAVLRVMVVALPDARLMLLVSAASWGLGFACFAWRYVPILTQPPLDPRLPA